MNPDIQKLESTNSAQILYGSSNLNGNSLAQAGGETAITGSNTGTGGTNTTSSKTLNDGAIQQIERLYTVRSRGGTTDNQRLGGDRGERAYIKILTTDPAATLARTGTNSNTSLGTSSQGVLYDAVSDPSSTKYGGYASFLLTDANFQLSEKLQVTQTFGDAEVAYYFGKAPIYATFSGILIDSVDNNWFTEWMEMYATVMRGSELARNYELIKLVLPNMTVIGSIAGMNYAQSSQSDTNISFNFQFLVKQMIPRAVTTPNSTFLSNGPYLIDPKSVPTFRDQKLINTMKKATLYLGEVVGNPGSTVSQIGAALNDYGARIAGVTGTVGGIGGTTGNSSGSGTNSLFKSLSANLAGVQSRLFSPVVNVLGSLSKLVKKATGTVASVVAAFTKPVQNVLRDIRNISALAIGLVNLAANSIDAITNTINDFTRDIQVTLATVKKAAGVITSAPETLGQALRRLVNSATLSSHANFLNTNNRIAFLTGSGASSKIALLNAGPPHTPQSGAHL